MPFLLGAVLLAGLGAGAPPGASFPGPAFVAADTLPSFSHDEHQQIECSSCHRMDAVHGGSLVQSVQDCRSCHHTEEARRDCADCHGASALEGRVFTVERTFAPSVHDAPSTRSLPFRHSAHEELECASCHENGVSLGVPELDCQSCHEEHHEPTTACLDCHREVGEEEHDRSVHVTCSSAGCHRDVPVESPPRSRAGCLWCHQDMTEHRPDQECVACHLVPTSNAAGRRSGGSP